MEVCISNIFMVFVLSNWPVNSKAVPIFTVRIYINRDDYFITIFSNIDMTSSISYM